MLRACLEAGLLFCPRCRAVQGGAFHHAPLVLGDILEEEQGAVVHGFLRCTGCAVRHPVLDGVPVLVKDTAEFVQRMEGRIFEREDLPGELHSWLLSGLGDGLDVTLRRQMVSIYGAAFASPEDPSEPEHDLPLTRALREATRQTRAFLAQRQHALLSVAGPSPLVLDAGCGLGASSLELAVGGARVLALDNDPGLLRLLSRLRRTGEVCLPRWRHGGNDYQQWIARRPDAVGSSILPIAADALNPPLGGDSLDLAVCHNLLDNVEQPVVLLRQLHALLKPGATLVLTTPYEWASRCTPPAHRLGETVRSGDEPDPAVAQRDLLQGRLPELAPELRFEVTYEREALPWVLPHHRRSYHVFLCHYVEARVLPA